MSFRIPDRPSDLEEYVNAEVSAAITDVRDLLKGIRSLNISASSTIFQDLSTYISSFDQKRHNGQPVAEVLYSHIATARQVLEYSHANPEEKEDAFETIKVAAFFLCWLCSAVQPAQANNKSKGKQSSKTPPTVPKDAISVWRTTLGALYQGFSVDMAPFADGGYHTRSLVDLCLKQVDQAARTAQILADKGCAGPLKNIIITLAHQHKLHYEVQKMLTHILYEVDDANFTNLLARGICGKCASVGYTQLPEGILQDLLELQFPEDYVRLNAKAARVAEFLTLISESCAPLVRHKFLLSLKPHLWHGPPEMRSAMITLIGAIIKHSDQGMAEISDASRLSWQQTNRTLLSEIMYKHIDEKARTRIKVIQCLDMLVENQKLSDDNLGNSFGDAILEVAKVALDRITDSKPTVRKAAMKLMQTLLARNQIGDDLDLYSVQQNKRKAQELVDQKQQSADAVVLVGGEDAVRTSQHPAMGLDTASSECAGDCCKDEADGQANDPMDCNAACSSVNKEVEQAQAQLKAAQDAESLIEAFHRCIPKLERLLTSDEQGDVVEAVTLLQLMRNLGIRPATPSIRNALQLVTVTGQKPEVQLTIVDMFENLYLSEYSDSKQIATALVELLSGSPSESNERAISSCLQGAMQSGKKSGLNYNAVADELFTRIMQLSRHFALGGIELAAADLHLRVLYAIATHKPGVCRGKALKLLDLAEQFLGRQYAVLQLRIVQFLILMFNRLETKVEVNCTEALKLLTRHLVGPAFDPTSIMLQKTCMEGLCRMCMHDPLWILRLICKTQLRTAAAMVQQQCISGTQRGGDKACEGCNFAATVQHSALDSSHPMSSSACEMPLEETGTGDSLRISGNNHDQPETAINDVTTALDHLEISKATGKDDACARARLPGVGQAQADNVLLARALVAVGLTALLHSNFIEQRMAQAEAEQLKMMAKKVHSSDDSLAAPVQPQKENVELTKQGLEADIDAEQLKMMAKVIDASDDSLAACVQPQEENVEQTKQGLEAEVEEALRPMARVVSGLCSGEAIFRVSKTLRSSALLALMKLMCAFRSVCEEDIHLRLLFTCLGPIRRNALCRKSVHPRLQLTLMAGIADLLNRWSNVIDPWTWRFFEFLDDHIEPQKHALRILTTLILSSMLKPNGHIYRVCYRLDDADAQVKAAAQHLFAECAKRSTDQGGNLVYKLLPDILSHLMKDSTVINQPLKFNTIMELLLQLVKGEKHHAMLVSSLMERLLHQTQPCTALLLLSCFKLLKNGTTTSKKIVQVVQQELLRLRRFLCDTGFANMLQEVLKKSLSTLKRSGKPEERDDAIAVIERVTTEIGAVHEDGRTDSQKE